MLSKAQQNCQRVKSSTHKSSYTSSHAGDTFAYYLNGQPFQGASEKITSVINLITLCQMVE